jgi:hypothetical protein
VNSITAPAPDSFVVSKRFDQQFFLLGAWLFPFGLWAVASSHPSGPLAALLLFKWVDYAHVVVTWPFVLFDRETMARDRLFYGMGFATLLALSAVATAAGKQGQVIWWSIFIYWGAFHIVRQHYGFLRLYQARERPRTRRAERAEVWCLYAGTAFPYLLNLNRGWALAAAEQAGEVIAIPVPLVAVIACGAVFAGALAVTVWEAFAARRAGVPVGHLRLLSLVLAVSNFWIGLLVYGQHDALHAMLFITSTHNIQYLAIIGYVARRRYAGAGAQANPLATLFTGRTFYLFLAGGSLVYLLVIGWLANMSPSLGFTRYVFTDSPGVLSYAANALIGTVYVHYLFDGRMWRIGQDARLRGELGLG